MKRPRRSASQQYLGGHQRAWVWGRHLVGEILRSGRWHVHELVLADNLADADRAAASAQAAGQGAAVNAASVRRCTELAQADDHQGYLARMGPFPYAVLEELLVPRPAGAVPLVAVLDGIQDDHNLGAIIRSAEVLGANGMVIGTCHQAGVTSLAARASAGAVCRLPIVRVPVLADAVARLRQAGFAVAGASEKAVQPVAAFDFRGPAAMALGSEGRGLSPAVAALCTMQVRIPQAGHIGSLNVAAAAAVILYEAMRQRI